MKDTSSSTIDLYSDLGIPDGFSIVKKGLTLSPKLVTISPSQGSSGGTVITATVEGVGQNTKGLELVDP
jgi:hypothetical protein